MKLEVFFTERPVFTYEEFTNFLAGQNRTNARTRAALLSYHVGTGRLLRLRRGLFASVPPGVSPEDCPVDPYLLAAKLADDAVLAYHTALELHGKAASVREEFLCLSRRAPRPLSFRDSRFRGVRFPKSLLRKRQEGYGVEKTDRAGLDLRVTGLERTVVDLLDRPALGGGWEEVWRSLASVEYLDVEQMVRYALLLDNATTAARVGFYLDRQREALLLEDKHLAPLLKHRPAVPHYLDRSRKPGKLASKWNLVVPERLLKRPGEAEG
ncbi:MAG: type IV toxin-antitoxin system AbiEi family antitoxin [Elusimicrobiota bacterium]